MPSLLPGMDPWWEVPHICPAFHCKLIIETIGVLQPQLHARTGGRDAVLDLQDVFNRSYDIGPYPERLDYQSDPMPALSDEDAAWANELLKTKGLRQ